MPDWDAVYNAVFNHQLPGRIARNLVRTLAQLTLHRQLEAWCIRKASLKLAGQLMKDPVKSAVRKAAKMGSFRAAKAMLKTSALSNALLYSTNLFIDEVGMLLEWLLPHQHVSERREVLKYAKIQVASSVLGFTFCTLGMAVGTLILPGNGTFWGGICGDLVPLLIYNSEVLEVLRVRVRVRVMADAERLEAGVKLQQPTAGAVACREQHFRMSPTERRNDGTTTCVCPTSGAFDTSGAFERGPRPLAHRTGGGGGRYAAK
eukprot:CAMPEP_0182542182 /NCGR_PEP_ID=MMETSP1323-20130603/29765_1 /TAXON_ID=236787 /ORGANISM="Florenciella parvula, Strain RCC1693" /LENGTH=260 /DNA_ID=CAMNT_0024753009 /DNA_START=1 /DNA_END=784 /DNA_ORIENTATION=-